MLCICSIQYIAFSSCMRYEGTKNTISHDSFSLFNQHDIAHNSFIFRIINVFLSINVFNTWYSTLSSTWFTTRYRLNASDWTVHFFFFTSTTFSVWFCTSVCQQDYRKTTGPRYMILLNLVEECTQHGPRKNPLGEDCSWRMVYALWVPSKFIMRLLSG